MQFAYRTVKCALDSGRCRISLDESREDLPRNVKKSDILGLVKEHPSPCSQRFLLPGRVGLLMMSEVTTASVSATLLIPDERMSAVEWTGAALIVAACLLEMYPAWDSCRRARSTRRVK